MADGRYRANQKTWPEHSVHVAALLKMRCDVSGADYAIFWRTDTAARWHGSMVAAGCYASPAHRFESEARGLSKPFAEASLDVVLELAGNSMVAKSYQSTDPIFYDDVQSCDFFVRREMAVQHGIKSICFTRGPQVSRNSWQYSWN